MNDHRRRVLMVVVVVAIALAPMGVAVAQTQTHTASSGTTYQTNSGVTITLADNRNVAQQPFTSSNTWSDQNLTVSGSDAAVTVSDTTYSGTPLTVSNVDIQGGQVSVARSDLNQTLTVTSGDANTIQLRDYEVGDGTSDIAYSSTNGLTVELSLSQPINVVAVDGSGSLLDSSTGSTATLQLPAGTNSVTLEPRPADLEVRNESNPDQLVTQNVSLTARLFSSNDTVIQRNVTNGTVSLSGVPLDEPVVVTVREENSDFVYRRILLDSIVQTSQIYILPTNEPSAQVRFQLADQTGRFDPATTRFFVEKPVTQNNSTEYRVISGDRVGADGEFPTILVDSQRYRLRVENEQGEQRVLGSYVVQGATVARIPIGEVEFTADIEEGAAVQANLRDAPDSASHDHEVRFVYLDPSGSTDNIEVSITNGSGGQIRPTTTESINGSSSAYVETYPLNGSFDPEQDTAQLTVDATQGANTITFTRALGDVPEVLTNAPIDTQVLELIGIVSLVAVVGLLVIVSPRMAALVGPGYAGALSITGIVGIPIAAVVLAGVVGVLANIGTARVT